MEFRQIQYFQAVVKSGSFTGAAELCHVSQSAISQQIKSLEAELGIALQVRKGRSFELTPAGHHFYEKSLQIAADMKRLCLETVRIAENDKATLRIGYLCDYSGREFRQAIAEFSRLYPNVDVLLTKGTHEELYNMLADETVDLAMNDQRRRFNPNYVNEMLSLRHLYVETAVGTELADHKTIELDELKDVPCILISSSAQRDTEKEYYRNQIGIPGAFIFAENLEDARLLVLTRKGILLNESGEIEENPEQSIKCIPLMHQGEPVKRQYCAFWSKENSGYYVEEFGEILKRQFRECNPELCLPEKCRKH